MSEKVCPYCGTRYTGWFCPRVRWWKVGGLLMMGLGILFVVAGAAIVVR
jgi:hypothetical protein